MFPIRLFPSGVNLLGYAAFLTWLLAPVLYWISGWSQSLVLNTLVAASRRNPAHRLAASVGLWGFNDITGHWWNVWLQSFDGSLDYFLKDIERNTFRKPVVSTGVNIPTLFLLQDRKDQIPVIAAPIKLTRGHSWRVVELVPLHDLARLLWLDQHQSLISPCAKPPRCGQMGPKYHIYNIYILYDVTVWSLLIYLCMFYVSIYI